MQDDAYEKQRKSQISKGNSGQKTDLKGRPVR